MDRAPTVGNRFGLKVRSVRSYASWFEYSRG
jgi:hypothetical protein